MFSVSSVDFIEGYRFRSCETFCFITIYDLYLGSNFLYKHSGMFIQRYIYLLICLSSLLCLETTSFKASLNVFLIFIVSTHRCNVRREFLHLLFGSKKFTSDTSLKEGFWCHIFPPFFIQIPVPFTVWDSRCTSSNCSCHYVKSTRMECAFLLHFTIYVIKRSNTINKVIHIHIVLYNMSNLYVLF